MLDAWLPQHQAPGVQMSVGAFSSSVVKMFLEKAL